MAWHDVWVGSLLVYVVFCEFILFVYVDSIECNAIIFTIILLLLFVILIDFDVNSAESESMHWPDSMINNN